MDGGPSNRRESALSSSDIFGNAGPFRPRDDGGDSRSFKTSRLARVLERVFGPLRDDLGVKNRLKDLGVTGGRFLGFKEGGEEGRLS